MDTLKEIIHSLSYDDIREFKLFINRQKKKKNRTDLNLFEILLHEKNEKPKGIVNKLYSNINKAFNNIYCIKKNG
jgi:DNA-binding MurR/RpiR family transcriptional regulator